MNSFEALRKIVNDTLDDWNIEFGFSGDIIEFLERERVTENTVYICIRGDAPFGRSVTNGRFQQFTSTFSLYLRAASSLIVEDDRTYARYIDLRRAFNGRAWEQSDDANPLARQRCTFSIVGGVASHNGGFTDAQLTVETTTLA